ncbi:hypothetical protein H6G54_19335 [Anabaena cylindrica FACHB-243]|uniref:Uncharacterized protein n=1 Tax=Anabaena cylindrica (strain ATCC 27899 / PCC 7122) TaxID=272123 RepID=K9ZNH9_ANACC|nr:MULTISPECIES: hypothetical protein [Anabaena]AFZ60746.1 hypothetical protein Anacy_5430 [Anabaena cylindrica PCC 7122]MBD2419819.1 hypothetical protein [Anabaena cylindrica FACHB-243]MBY5281320.1 hypothetical protein [Anabaena sp. CCAP 1446/1C]MBY5309030.1 hypothetical protein [Anabaena sp. CCAP 1446/1C]MCM2406746.1 hypothetical protein [Anabaena sp. CCAP 1446/1C]
MQYGYDSFDILTNDHGVVILDASLTDVTESLIAPALFLWMINTKVPV